MVGVKDVVNVVAVGVGLVRHHAALPSWWPDATIVAAVAILAGLVLALWGGRVLRVVYVLAFTGAGAAVGIRIARVVQIDDLIGLVLGAGAAGLAGHLLYRWWVGVTAGVCAVLVVATVAAARNLPQIQAELEVFADQRLGVGTGQYAPGPPGSQASQAESIRTHLAELAAYLWDTRRDAVIRVGAVLGLAWLTGLVMGLALPRFTTILGTSLIGVSAVALGLGLVISTRWPGLWAVVGEQAAWFVAGLILVLVVSLAYQIWHGQRAPAAPVPPAAAAA